LTDNETASVITFIYSHMVNCFKGALTEMLAVAPCSRALIWFIPLVPFYTATTRHSRGIAR
jgi:hypothetical protein